MNFEIGQRARYKGDEGVIAFVDPQCITICVRVFPGQKVRNVCLVVNSIYDFDNVKYK